MKYMTKEFYESHITVRRLMDRPEESEWDVVALKQEIDSPFTSARLMKMASLFMAIQILELEKEDSFYKGVNMYGQPISNQLYSLIPHLLIKDF